MSAGLDRRNGGAPIWPPWTGGMVGGCISPLWTGGMDSGPGVGERLRSRDGFIFIPEPETASTSAKNRDRARGQSAKRLADDSSAPPNAVAKVAYAGPRDPGRIEPERNDRRNTTIQRGEPFRPGRGMEAIQNHEEGSHDGRRSARRASSAWGAIRLRGLRPPPSRT
jgi:hypothetical protein